MIKSLAKKGVAMVVAALLCGGAAQMAEAQDVTFPEQSSDPVALDLSGATPSDDLLRVFVQGAETPMAGEYSHEDETLLFDPAFGFEIGQDYVARVLWDGAQTEVGFRLPNSEESVPATVIQTYPSGDVLPENTLRFYIHFSTPMQPHVAFDYIRLVDASGVEDEAAFMRFRQELWNEDRTRLTVLFDPGRIKREVATNLELGPALLSGEHYTLLVEGGWPSADGSTVLSTFSRTFRVSGPLRTRPDASLWGANVPCAGTRDPLTIGFDRPFDRHLLTRALRVETEAGAAINGVIEVADAEHAWSLTPHQPWSLEDFSLVASPFLEDVAGNNFRDLLDHVAGSDDITPSAINLRISIQDCTG